MIDRLSDEGLSMREHAERICGDDIRDLKAELRAAEERAEAAEKDARRWQFYAEHWQSDLGGQRLWEWLPENAFRLGGIDAAIDAALAASEKGEG